jgi:hypothetical protein
MKRDFPTPAAQPGGIMTITVGSDTAKTRRSLKVGGTEYAYYSIAAAEAAGLGDFSRLPAALKVVLENMLRFEDGKTVTVDDIKAFSLWAANGGRNPREIAYRPARVLMQDFTGVPAVVDLAAMRDAMVSLGGDPQKINPLNPVDLVIDHSVMVDEFGNPRAFQLNVEREYQRNGERYEFLKWGQGAFANFRVCRRAPASAIRSISNTSARRSGPTPTRRARPWPIPTRWSAPTATPPWSTASRSSAGASAGSRPRRRCSVSRSRC